MRPEGHDTDVVVVGWGPVGHLVAALLAARGRSVVVLEKHRAPYRLPRAVHLTGEVLRCVDAVGAAEGWERWAEPITSGIELLDADHGVLLHIPHAAGVPQGWPADVAVHQPSFEDALRGCVSGFSTRTGAEVIGVIEDAEGVTAEYRASDGVTRRVRGRYLVACDGANSPVRALRGIPVVDTGFSADWLVVDVRSELPFRRTADVTQVCDPRRPTTCVASGPGRRRFEFMRVGGESAETLSDAESVRHLLEPWGYTPANATVEKHEMYAFRARWARRWVDGRVVLAGDAAHQMPPMGGAGLTSGIRDAANLAWKLDLVLRGVAGPALLDTYATERSAHVQHAIQTSIGFGRLVCETDPGAAAGRDAALRAQGPRAIPPPPPERLGPGALDPTPDPGPAGTLGAQGRLRSLDGRTALADRWSDGFTVLVDGNRIDAGSARLLARRLPAGIGAAVLLVYADDSRPRHPDAGRPHLGDGDDIRAVVDFDGVYGPRWAATGAVVEIQRPDHYVYGTATDLDGALHLAGSLRTTLHLLDRDRPDRDLPDQDVPVREGAVP